MRANLVLLLASAAFAQQTPLTPGVKPFISIADAAIALAHVRVLDGTGAPAKSDQTIVIESGKIRAVGDSATTAIPPGIRTVDLSGHTVIPGLVGMHEHMFYPSGGGIPVYNEHALSHPRLYLASGVTTARTAGSLEPYTDLNLKKLIDEGRMPGPKMDVTGPYVEGPGGFRPQMPELNTPEEARRLIEYWASVGATSFKAFMHISRAALGEAIKAAHERGIKVTGHLCSIGFREAAALGIDDLEHGLVVDSEFAPGKQPDVCPQLPQVAASIENLDLNGAPAQQMIRDLVQHKVAITSTLAVFEAMQPGRPPLEPRMLDAMSPSAALSYLAAKERAASLGGGRNYASLRKEMDFEREFVRGGGLLIAGADPTGNGGALAGFADQRNIELLVKAGFTPAEAIKIASYNGALYLGQTDKIGSIAEGKQADLVVLEGDPSTRITDVEEVRIVFKDGVGYDPVKLLDSIRGAVGLH